MIVGDLPGHAAVHLAQSLVHEADGHVEIARHHRGASWLDVAASDALRWRKGMCELHCLHEEGLLEAIAPIQLVWHWASLLAECGMHVAQPHHVVCGPVLQDRLSSRRVMGWVVWHGNGNGMASCGLTWQAVVWQTLVWHGDGNGMTRSGMARSGTAMTWQGLAWQGNGMARSDMANNGLAWQAVVWHDKVWHGIGNGKLWSGMAWQWQWQTMVGLVGGLAWQWQAVPMAVPSCGNDKLCHPQTRHPPHTGHHPHNCSTPPSQDTICQVPTHLPPTTPDALRLSTNMVVPCDDAKATDRQTKGVTIWTRRDCLCATVCSEGKSRKASHSTSRHTDS